MAETPFERYALLRYCLAFACIIDSVSAIPLESIPEVNLRFSEINSTLSGPIPGAYRNGSIFIGFITDVRGQVMAGGTGGVVIRGWWTQLLMMKGAIAAFMNGSIVEKGAPTSIYPIDYHVLFGDEASFDPGNIAVPSSSAHASGLAHRMLRGNNLAGQNFPPIRTLIASFGYPQLLGKLSSAYRTPQIGFSSDDLAMGMRKHEFPYFMRTMPTTKFLVGALFVRYLNYTRVDELGCSSAFHASISDRLLELYNSLGIEVYSVLFPQGEHTAWPPGYPPAGEPTLAIHTDFALKERWDFLFKLLRENNAHVHLNYMETDCPAMDLLSYAALVGLVGKGHLWLGQNFKSVFDREYVFVLRVVGPRTHGVVSPYAFVKPLDGAVAVEAKTGPELDRFHDWLKWIDDNGLRTTLIPEPHLQSVLTSEALQKRTDSAWRGGIIYQYHVFDCMYTTLLAINKLLLTVGVDFTNDQLLDAMKKVEFSGLTGDVRFNYTSGDRIAEEELLQYRVNYSGRHIYKNVPLADYRRLVDDNYAELKARRLVERHSETRRLATCVTPPDDSLSNLGTYLQCITTACEDADGSIVTAMSSGQVPNCQAAYAAAAAQGGDCDTDLAALLPTIPSGTYLWTLCPGQCKSQCADQRCYTAEIETCTPTGVAPQALASYFGCLASLMMDGSGLLLSTMTGGAMSSCKALHTFVVAQGGDCDYDLNALSAALPVGTPLRAICQATCAAVPPVCQVPAQLAGAALAVYFACLEQHCYDADDGLVSTLSGSQIPSCAMGLAAAAGDCTFDLSTLLPSLPAGFQMWQLCGVTCKATCVAEKDKCQVPADASDATLLQSYFSCIEGTCANAEDQLVSALSGSQIPSCAIGLAAVSGDCTFDLSTLLPSLPAGFQMWQLCGAECKAECETATAPPSLCIVPSTPTPAALLPYFDCLRGVCENSPDSLVSQLSGSQIQTCAIGLAAAAGDCTFDLSTLLPSLPAGFQMWQLCGATCSHECLANPGPNRTIDSYVQCRKNYCADSAPIVISNLTGGNVADCAALKTIAQDDCTYDVAQTMPRLGVATPLWKICSASCGCIDGSGPAPPPPPPPKCPEDPAGCDWYSVPEKMVAIGKYVNDLEMIDTPLFYDLTPIPPPNVNLPCQLGQIYETQSGECLSCPKGKYTNKLGETICSACVPGEANPNRASASCAPCQWGKFSDQFASAECKNCTAGRYTGEPSQTQCRSCSSGQYSLEGANGCTFCEAGRFQNQFEASACHACDQLIPGSVSGAAATTNTSCKCPESKYYRPSIGCQTCVQGLECFGGNEIPYQVKGFQAYITDSVTRSYEVYECSAPDWCPRNLPGTCVENREGASCARLFGKGCPWYFGIGIPIVGVIVAVIAYKVTAHSQYGAVTQVMILSGNISIAFVAMQAIDVYLSFFITLPDDLQWITHITQIFMMQFNMVMPQCNLGQSFLARYSMGIIPPIAVVGVFMCLWAATGMLACVFPFIAPFSFDGTINVIGMILQVLYVMQCKDALAFFNTISHPSGQHTLKSFRDVVVWSNTHVSVGTLIVAAYLFIFYVIGTYCIFVWVVASARKKVRDARFVTRFRFVLLRWRPECWHWGLLLLGRNFCIAITPIVARTDIAFQSALYVILLMGHALMEARYMPWAAMVNTWFEIIISTILSLMAVGGLIFDDDKHATPEEKAMILIMSMMFVSIVIIFVFSVVWVVRSGSKAKRAKAMETRMIVGCDLISLCAMIADKLESGEAGVQKAWKRFSENSGDYDYIVLRAAYAYVLRFSEPDPLRRATFISSITSSNCGVMTSNESERPVEAAHDTNVEKQMEKAQMSSSMSSHAPMSMLEELGLEAHGRLKVAPDMAENEVSDAKSETSDNTVIL